MVLRLPHGDFYSSEQSHIMPVAGSVKITLNQADGSVVVRKEKLGLKAGEIMLARCHVVIFI